MGVPVTAHLAVALSLQAAIEACTLGFLILWASSSIIRAHRMHTKGQKGNDLS